MKILLLSAVLLALAGCGGGERVDAVPSASSVGAASSPALPDGSGWVYSGVVDEMRGKTSYMAKLRSVNRVDIGGGHGDVGLDLIFGGYEEYDFPIALFRLSDGEFAECGSDGCKVEYRVDDGAVLGISGYLADSGSIMGCSARTVEEMGITGCMIENSALFYSLLDGRKMVVEVDISGRGPTQFVFDVSGLQPLDKWPGLAVVHRK
ncbi:hypothetical protein ACTHSI_00495 [Neisseria sp. P0001.S004]|uniref:hypothetical protein n=1 Tax=Neisseria sp. P0001.S005 TaxID=3436649 RepID=UPI003F7F4831